MVSRIRTALNAAIRNATAHYNRGREFSRKRTLTRETVIRLLISAEGGSLAKILHDAGIQATASALSQRRAQIPPEVFRTVFTNFNSTCADNEFFCGYRRGCCRKWGYLRRQRHCHRVRPAHLCLRRREDGRIHPAVAVRLNHGDVAHFFPCVALNGQSIGAA